MASVITKTRQEGVTTIRSQLISAAVATGNGEWINIEGLSPFSIHVDGITTATVTVNGSNSASQPNDSDHEIVLASITSDNIYEFTVPVRWLKARVSAYTAGTITVEFMGRSSR